MSPSSVVLTCPECHTSYTGPFTRTFLGFRKFTCPACSKNVLNPLTTGYRLTYWILLFVTASVFIIGLLAGQIAPPGVLAAGLLIAVIRDAELRYKVRGALPPT